MDFERRFWKTDEIRAGEDDNGSYLEGYAVPYEQLSVMLWGFKEEMARGAFAESIGSDDIRSLWQHDTAQVLGRKKNRTLTVYDDDYGVGFRVYPPDTQVGRDALTSVRRGDVDQVSIGFSVHPYGDEWREAEDGTIVRRVNRGKLIEISPVTFAAYPQTVVQARGLPLADNVFDESFGLIVAIPAELRRASSNAVDTLSQARARWARHRKILDLLYMGMGDRNNV